MNLAVATKVESTSTKLEKDRAAIRAFLQANGGQMPWSPKDFEAKKTWDSIDRQRRIQALFAENPTISFRQVLSILMAELLSEFATDAETVEFYDDSKKWFEHFKPAVPA